MTQEDIQKINDKLRKERENRIPNIIKWLEEMTPFTEGSIPEPLPPPRFNAAIEYIKAGYEI